MLTITEQERKAIASEARRRSLAIVGGLDSPVPFDVVLGKLEQACQRIEEARDAR